MKKMTLTRTANTSSWLRKSNCVEASRKKRKAKGRPRGALAKSRGLRLLPSPPCANRAAALANTLSARWWPSYFGLLSPSPYPWSSNFREPRTGEGQHSPDQDRCQRQEKSRAALGRGKIQRAPGLTIDRIVLAGGPEHIPQMSDFFLAQINDSFTTGLCFDNRKEGEGGA